MLAIRAARTSADLRAVRTLFEAYAVGLGVDLSFQDFAAELAGLPGAYAPPQGALLLAVDSSRAAGEAADDGATAAESWAGCVALRPLPPDRGGAEDLCEMKRLYVGPAFRGRGLGRRLAEAILAEARRLNYRGMRLDTLRTLTAAMALYAQLGFVEIPAYYANPIPDVAYFEMRW